MALQPTRLAHATPVKFAHTLELYRSSSGRLPASPLLEFVSLSRARATQKYVKGLTLLDTTASMSSIAGYVTGATSSLVLSRTQGFELAFSIQILAETHRGADRNRDGIADRAGFSVVLLGEDAKGIELDFWPNSVWAQADGINPPQLPILTHAESATIATTRMQIYRLQIKGDVYTLFAADQPILTGPVRDYRAFELFPAVYAIPNFIFLGDNSASAQARVAIRDVVVSY